MKNINKFIIESSDKSSKCHIVDLKNKKVVETGTQKEMTSMFFDKGYIDKAFDENKKVQYICVTDDELKNGNFYIKPGEIKI